MVDVPLMVCIPQFEKQCVALAYWSVVMSNPNKNFRKKYSLISYSSIIMNFIPRYILYTGKHSIYS